MTDGTDRDRVRRRFPRRRGRAGWAHTAHRARPHGPRPVFTPHVESGAGVTHRAHRGQARGWRVSLVVAAVVLTGCGPTAEAPHYPNLNSPGSSTSAESPPATNQPGADVTPTAVRIPSIGVNNNQMMQVGLNPDRSLEVPPLSEPALIGWYRDSPLPGESPMCTFDAGCPGSAVLAGHINGNGMQGAFAKLSKVKVGDTIEVSRSDKKVAVFTVYKVMIFQKANFPTKDIYGTTSSAELRVITCGPSDLDRAAGSYRQQTVLKAKLVSLKPAGP